MKSKILFGLILTFGFAFIGFKISTEAQKFQAESELSAVTSPHNMIARDPAAIRKNYDFSELAGDALDQASKQRLIDGAVVHQNPGEVGVELGHFVVKGQDGTKSFACAKYTQIILQFEGDGSASSGQKPEMEVEGSCEVAPDISMIAPLWIPVAKILGEPVADGEFDFRENHPVRVRFANLVHDWPLAWRLKGVRMLDPQNPVGEVDITDQDLQRISSKPLIVQFQTAQ